MLPISVATELRHERPVPPKRFECVTLLFSGIVGFSDYCAGHADSKGAMKIVRMLNQLYTAFDVLTDPKKNPNVYKVRRTQSKYDLPSRVHTHTPLRPPTTIPTAGSIFRNPPPVARNTLGGAKRNWYRKYTFILVGRKRRVHN